MIGKALKKEYTMMANVYEDFKFMCDPLVKSK